MAATRGCSPAPARPAPRPQSSSWKRLRTAGHQPARRTKHRACKASSSKPHRPWSPNSSATATPQPNSTPRSQPSPGPGTSPNPRQRLLEPHMAHHRNQPVVSAGVDHHGPRAERRDESVHTAEEVRARPGGRRQEPGRALEQLGVRAVGTSRLGAADRMATDEAAVSSGGGADGALRRADIGDRRIPPARARAPRERRGAVRRRVPRRRTRSAPSTASGSVAAGSTASRSLATRSTSGSGSQPAHDSARPPGRESRGRADQTRPDDGEVPKHDGRYPRISSATRNARSSDWRAFKRGSQSDSYRVSSCSSSTASEPPRHSVTSSPVISR